MLIAVFKILEFGHKNFLKLFNRSEVRPVSGRVGCCDGTTCWESGVYTYAMVVVEELLGKRLTIQCMYLLLCNLIISNGTNVVFSSPTITTTRLLKPKLKPNIKPSIHTPLRHKHRLLISHNRNNRHTRHRLLKLKLKLKLKLNIKLSIHTPLRHKHCLLISHNPSNLHHRCIINLQNIQIIYPTMLMPCRQHHQVLTVKDISIHLGKIEKKSDVPKPVSVTEKNDQNQRGPVYTPVLLPPMQGPSPLPHHPSSDVGGTSMKLVKYR